MTNYEKLMSLNVEEVAWFIHNLGEGCRTCIFKALNKNGLFYPMHEYDEHFGCDKEKKGDDDTCIGGRIAWCNREQTKDDKRIFAIITNNVLVERFNSMSNEERCKWRTVCEDGLVVGIEPFSIEDSVF